MRTGNLESISKYLKLALALGAILYIATYIYIALSRIAYPFDLEWIEGASVGHVARILDGKGLYVSPTIDFVPLAYTPLYYYVSAAFAYVMGLGLAPLRLVSFLSSLGCLLIIMMMARRETGSSFAGLLAAGLYAAAFKLSGGWYDLARVDSLFVLLILISIYILRFYNTLIAYILSGIFIFLAFMTKQTAILISLPLMLNAIIIDKKRGLIFPITVLLLMGLGTIILNRITNGWFDYYIFTVVSGRPMDANMIFFFVWKIIPFVPALIFALFYFFIRHSHANNRQFIFYLMMAAGMVGVPSLSRFQVGTFLNVMMPVDAAIAILFGLGVFTAMEYIRSETINRRIIFEIAVYLFCMAGFINFMYNPFAHIPSKLDREADKELLATISKYKGEVFMPYHSEMPSLVGKKCYAHYVALAEVLRGNNTDAGKILAENIRQKLRSGAFDAVILCSDEPDVETNDIYKEYYIKDRPVFSKPLQFRMIEGVQLPPETIYLPRNNMNNDMKEKE